MEGGRQKERRQWELGTQNYSLPSHCRVGFGLFIFTHNTWNQVPHIKLGLG